MAQIASTRPAFLERWLHPKSWNQAQGKFFSLLLTPSLILLTVITLVPFLFLIMSAFTSWDLSRPGSLVFNDLQNFIDLFTKDERFLNSIWVQVRYTLLTVPLQVLIGLSLAVYVKSRVRSPWLVSLTRSIFIIPMVIPPVVAALIWKILFTPSVSILNYFTVKLGFGQLAWLGDPNLAIIALAIANIWEFFPFCFLLLYAGLQSLPDEPMEAARVDGASAWQTFRFVTLPMLRPVMSIVILFQLVDSIRTFPLVYIMTDGGPGFVTETTNYYAYGQAFNYSYVGYSSAMILVVFIFTLGLTFLVLRSVRWSRGNQ